MAGPYHHITLRLESDILILTLELEQVKDYVVAEELRYEMMHAAKRFKRKKIVVDLQNMTFMTSLACVAFIGLKAGVRDNHARIVMCNMSEFIRKVFNAKRLLTPSQNTGSVTFEEAETLNDALARLAEPIPASEEERT